MFPVNFTQFLHSSYMICNNYRQIIIIFLTIFFCIQFFKSITSSHLILLHNNHQAKQHVQLQYFYKCYKIEKHNFSHKKEVKRRKKNFLFFKQLQMQRKIAHYILFSMLTDLSLSVFGWMLSFSFIPKHVSIALQNSFANFSECELLRTIICYVYLFRNNFPICMNSYIWYFV